MASFPVPGWRNGIRTALKMRRAKAHEGSIPSPGTSASSMGFHRPDTIDRHCGVSSPRLQQVRMPSMAAPHGVDELFHRSSTKPKDDQCVFNFETGQRLLPQSPR